MYCLGWRCLELQKNGGVVPPIRYQTSHSDVIARKTLQRKMVCDENQAPVVFASTALKLLRIVSLFYLSHCLSIARPRHPTAGLRDSTSINKVTVYVHQFGRDPRRKTRLCRCRITDGGESSQHAYLASALLPPPSLPSWFIISLSSVPR